MLRCLWIHESIKTAEVYEEEFSIFFSLSEHYMFGVQIVIGEILEMVVLKDGQQLHSEH